MKRGVANRWRGCALTALTALLAGAATIAQDGDDLTLPPRLEDNLHAARLEPQPEERIASLEEVIVIGENEWRLPDLGTAWRVRQEDEQDEARIETSFLPIYDPDKIWLPRDDSFPFDRELRRVDLIEVFRIRFGRRSAE